MAPNDPAQKLSIYSLEGTRISVTAMFNPTEVHIDKSVPWQKQAKSSGDQPGLEFWLADGRVMWFELLFDGFQSGLNVHTAFVADLTRLAEIMEPNDGANRRPPRVGVKWGAGKLPEFQGVIESLSTNYTMFLPDGTPVRATCRVAIREADKVAVRKP